MNLQDVYFFLPQAAYGLFLVPVLAWLFWNLYKYRKEQLDRFASAEVREVIFFPRRSRTLFAAKACAICLVWILSTLALMQPVSYGHYSAEMSTQPPPEATITGKRRRKAHEVIFLIDVSDSMSVPDARNGKTRIEMGKEIADSIVSRLKGETVALHAFTTIVTQLSPLTLDYLFVRLMLRDLSINEGGTPGTNITHALSAMKELYFATPTSIKKTLILLSDGGDTEIESLQGEAKATKIKELLSPLQDASTNHLRVITIGLGSHNAAPIPGITYEGKTVFSGENADLLKQIAQVGQGNYYFANDYVPLDLAVEVTKKLEKEQTETQEETVQATVIAGTKSDNLVHHHYYGIPLGLAIVLLGLTLVLQKSWARRLAILVLCFSGTACADETLSRHMHQAEAFFETKQYEHARDLYQNMLQDIIKPWERAIIMSNLGYVLMANHEWDQAIATFNSVPLDNELSTLLRERTAYGLTLTYYYQAMATDNFSQRIVLLNQALKAIEPAQQAKCALLKAEGDPKCKPDPQLVRLAPLIQYQIAHALQSLMNEKLTDPNAKEGLPLLLDGVNYSLAEQKFIHQPKISEDLKKQYVSLLISDNASSTPLWTALKQKFHKNPKDSQRANIFDKAEIEFIAGQVALKKGDIEKSLRSFELSAEELKKLIALPPPPSPAPSPPKPKPEQQTPQQSKQQEKETPQSDKKEAIDQVLRLLLKMNNEDTITAPQRPSPQKVLRPW